MIGDRDIVNGFRLAGVHSGTIIERSEDARTIIDGYLLNKESGIIIITEKIYHDLEKYIFNIKTKKRNPIIISVPDRFGPRDDIINLKNLLRTLSF
ncbi:MAG: V-type ATP synthase subunit F [Candidatus Helarchaeota archaeon]